MKIFLRIFLAIIAIIIIGIGVIVAIYFSWEKNFTSTIGDSNCVHGIDLTKVNTDEKIKDFVLSYSKTEYISFSKEEVLSFLSTSIVKSGDGIQIQDICVVTGQDTWKIYPKLKIGNISLPWFRLDFVKDKMETAELYVSKIAILDKEIPDAIVKGIKDKINKGISDAILLVNENGFGGRTFQNIELKEDAVIIKGISN